MIDTLRLTAEEAIGLLERREVSAAELHAAYVDAIAARDPELHCYLTTLDEPNGAGIPIALKDVISTKGVPTTAGSKILEGYVPLYDATVAERCKAAGPVPPRQDEHGRVRDGLVHGELGLRPVAQPVGPGARAGRLGRRLGGGRDGRARPVGARLRHRRLDQAALGALRQRRPAPHLRHRPAVRRRRLRVEPRPGRPGGEDGARLRAPLLDHRRPRPARLDHRRAPGARPAPRRGGSRKACGSASRGS